MQVIILIDFMEKAIKLRLATLLVCTLTITCQHVDKLNSSKILEVSLNYILNHQPLVKEYKNQPFQIINYKKNPIDNPIVVNGKKCLILPDTTNSFNLLRKMDIYKPLPVVEIINIANKPNDIIIVELIFRATGHAFFLTLKDTKNGQFSVISISERTI